MKKVSIIIPVYNVEHYIEESLRSALCQTYAEIEYIIVDDCGTDHSIEIARYLCDSVEYRYRQVKFVQHEYNRGVSAARNTGLLYATGEYIFFMDPDDIMKPNCIELHYEAIQKGKADFCVANIQIEGAKSIHIKEIDCGIEQSSPLFSFLKRSWSDGVWNKLYRKDFIETYGIRFNKKMILAEDALWNYQYASLAKKVTHIKEATYIYKIHSNSATTKGNGARKIESLLFLFDVLDMDYQNGKISSINKKVFFNFWDFKRLNTALLLLNFDGTNDSARQYYRRLKQLGYGRWNTLYAVLLKLPYSMFGYLLGPLYVWYKRRVTV